MTHNGAQNRSKLILKDQQKWFISLQKFQEPRSEQDPSLFAYRKLLFLRFDAAMVDSEADKKRLSFKDALLNKYSQDEDEELCFIQNIHISGSPKHKGEISVEVKSFNGSTTGKDYRNKSFIIKFNNWSDGKSTAGTYSIQNI